MPNATDPIAVFDSGVGGLTVLHELLTSLPQEDFLYLGDTAHFPYGVREADELKAFSRSIADHLLERGAKLIVIACNSATAAAREDLESYLQTKAPGVELVSVITPESKLAAEASKSGRIGLLATPTTVSSGAYEQAVAQFDSSATLIDVAAADLAPIIQGGFPFDQEVVDTVRTYCQPLIEADVDAVILGCTHYPLVAPMLQRILGRGVALITAGHAVAEEVEAALHHSELVNPRSGEGEYGFICTGDVEAFRSVGTRFLQMPLGEVAHVDI